jgi:hypothetical protein
MQPAAKPKGKGKAKETQIVVSESKKLRGLTTRSKRQSIPRSTPLVRSLTNPFTGSTCVPDGTDGACFSINQTVVMPAGAGGGSAFFLSTDPGNLFYVAAGDATAGWIVPAASTWTAATNFATVTAVFARVRPVSAAVRISFVGATMTDSGSTMYAECPGIANPALQNANAANSFSFLEANSIYSETHPTREELVFSWRPEDFEDIAEYNNIIAPGTVILGGPAPNNVPYLCVGILGAQPTVNTVRVEFQVNFEGQWRNRSIQIGESSTRSKPAIPGWFEKTMNIVKYVPQVLPVAALVADSWMDPTGSGIRSALKAYRTL